MKEVILDSIFCVIETLIILYFIESNFNRRGLNSFSSTILIFSILLTADLCVTFLNIPSYFQVLIFITLCSMILLIFYNGNILKKLYIAFITVLLIVIPSFLTIYIVSWVSNTDFSDFICRSDALRIMTNISIKLLQFITIKIVLRFQKKENYNIAKQTIIFYVAIMIASIISVVKIRNELLSGEIKTIFSIYITIIIIIIDLCLYLLIYYCSELNQRNLDIEMQRLTIIQQQKEIENIIQDYYETLKIRHDIKKYLSIAIELMNEKEYDKLESYLKSFHDNTLGNAKAYINTENKMFNAIINQKLNEADRSEIKIECCVFDDLSDFKGMDNLELCLIFLNLLDNAIEAEKEVIEPIIKLNIFAKAGYVCFKIENIVDDDILASNPNLRTTKKHKSIHGIGLKSVCEIIERHDGIFNISQNGKWFSVEIMLLKNAVQDKNMLFRTNY